MRRTKRDFKGNPLSYFKEHFGNRKITRYQLQKEDVGLYGALRSSKQLDSAIPERLRKSFKGNPLSYFREHYLGREITRSQLQKENWKLYNALRKTGQMDQAIERQYRDFKGNPLAYFKEHYKNRKLTRRRLEEEDTGLYQSLLKAGQLELAIPERQHRDFKGKPLAYFREKYRNRKITRSQLSREDGGLYAALLKAGNVDQAIPENHHRCFKGNPLAYFREKYKNRKITRSQFFEEDGSLYNSLRKTGQMDQAIPERQIRDFKGNPLAVFKKLYGNRKITRSQLQKEDGSLYSILRIAGQLDSAIPRNYRGYPNPLAFFKMRYKEIKITRSHLRKEDGGLYCALKRAAQLDLAIPELHRKNFKNNPVADFKEKYGNRKITRSQLRKENSSLYKRLLKEKQIDQAIPERQIRDFKGNPIVYFREKYSDKKITRGQLQKEDAGLYSALIKRNLLGQVIPEKIKTYRGYKNPLAYFNAHYSNRRITRSQLDKEDHGLYQALRKRGQLDEAIPKLGPITNQVQYRSFLEQNPPAKNLTALAASSNGLSGAVLDRLVDIYPDRLQKSRTELPKWVESLGPYLGPFTLPLRGNITPTLDVLLKDLPEQILDDDFQQILFIIARDAHMQQFNKSPKKTLALLEIAVNDEKQPYVKNLMKQVYQYYSDVYNLEIPGIKPLAK